MRYWYDCEFIEDGKTIDLISIGVVCEDGREFYAQNLQCEFREANEWVKANVLPHLTQFDLVTLKPIIDPYKEGGYGDWYSRGSIASELALSQMAGTSVIRLPDPNLELWSYYGAYDHVALCQLFGRMIDLPKGMPMYTRDLKQWCDALGNPKLPEQGKNEHHALLDARWNKQVYEFLRDYQARPNLQRTVDAGLEARTLSDKDLVSAYLLGAHPNEVYAVEMCRRLWPEWTKMLGSDDSGALQNDASQHEQ